MIRHLSRSLVLGSLLVLSSPLQTAKGGTLPCKDALLDKTKQFAHDLKQSKGASLMFKKAPVSRNTKWAGFLSKRVVPNDKSRLLHLINYLPDKFGKFLSGRDEFTLTPINGLYNITIDKPVKYLSGKLFRTTVEPSFFVKFAFIVAVGIGAYSQVEAAYQNQVDGNITSQIQIQRALYEEALHWDFRFNGVKRDYERGYLNREQALEKVFFVSLSYLEYFDHLSKIDEFTDLEANLKLQDHYLFQHLTSLLNEGVVDYPGYYVPHESIGQLNNSQKLALFINAHELYLKYQLIIEMFNNSEVYQLSYRDELLDRLVKEIEEDPFTEKVKALYKEELLTQNEVTYILQENAFWMRKFKDWQVLNITRLQISEDGFSQKPLTIDVIQEEILTSYL